MFGVRKVKLLKRYQAEVNACNKWYLQRQIPEHSFITSPATEVGPQINVSSQGKSPWPHSFIHSRVFIATIHYNSTHHYTGFHNLTAWKCYYKTGSWENKEEGIVNYPFNVILPQAHPLISITLDTVQPKVDLAQSETRHLR